MDFVVPADHRVKMKTSEKKKKELKCCVKAEKALKHKGDAHTINSRRVVKSGLEEIYIRRRIKTIFVTEVFRLKNT